MPPRIRLAGPPSPQPAKPDNADDEDNFSPSQIPPPDETPPPASPDSNTQSPAYTNNKNKNDQSPSSPPKQNNDKQQQQQQIDVKNPTSSAHLRKRSDVTMRAEYERELDRKHQLTVRAHENQKSANLDGTGSERNALYDENGRPITSGSSLFGGEPSEEDQLQVAKAALRAAKIREQQTSADLRRAREELDTGRGAGELRTSNLAAPPTPNASDVQIRKLDPQRLQQNAKHKREQLDEQKKAAREQKENAIFRGPEVAQVSAAAQNLRTEVNLVCQETIDAMETAIAELRDEKEELMIRLERTERGIRDDAARAEGELHWIDYASAEAKRMIDEANAQREKEKREKERKEELAKRRRGQSFVGENGSNSVVDQQQQQQQQKPTWK